MTNDESESSPLLRRLSPAPTQTEGSLRRVPRRRRYLNRIKSFSATDFLRNHVIAILYMYLIILEFGNYLQAAPRASIYENIICRAHFAKSAFNGSEHQNRCKDDEVQDELAFVRGMQEMFDCLPGLFLAIPYGHLANRYGRKLILFTSLLGMCLQYTWVLLVTWFSSTFPIRTVWVSSLFLVIGGGQSVSRSLAFVIVSDVTPEKHRATIFFRIEAVALIARALASALSSLIMGRSLWLPMILGLALIYAGSFFALLLPSTGGEAWKDLGNGQSASDETASLLSNKPAESMWRAIWKAISRDKRILLLLAAAILGQLSSRTTGLLMQYVAERFDWTWARANMILVLRMVVTTVALLLLIPLATAALPRLPVILRPRSKDLFLARGSTLLLTVGLVLMSLASEPGLMITGVTIFSSGFGFLSSIRSVMTTVILQEDTTQNEDEGEASQSGRDHISILYATMQLGQTVAKSAAGPIYAGLYNYGRELHGVYQGLPFGFAAILAFLVHGALWLPLLGGNQNH